MAANAVDKVSTHINRKKMARPIAETPVLYGSDAQRFEDIIQSTTPYSQEKQKALRQTYEDFKSKVQIHI